MKNASHLSSPCHVVTTGRYEGTYSVDWHVHPEHEIILVTAGRCRMSAGRDLWFEGQAGTLYFLPMGLDQYHYSHEFTRDVFLRFQAPPELFRAEPRTLQIPLESLCARLFDDICDLCLSPAGHHAQAVLDTLMQALLLEINRLEQRGQESGHHHPAIRRAVEFMENNLTRALSVAEIAQQAAISPPHLSALFREAFDCPPLRLHTRWRLELATKLLLGGRLRVKDIAAATGFCDANYFIRQFRHQFGVAPVTWLRQQANRE
jgi:AraC-like DNA-binding protein/uncharacterized cupin superfamily protein